MPSNDTQLTPEQQKLVEENITTAEIVANSSLGKYRRAGLSRDEILSACHYGLVCAARSFDPSRGFLFSSHAQHRCRGAISDWARDRSGRWYTGVQRRGKQPSPVRMDQEAWEIHNNQAYHDPSPEDREEREADLNKVKQCLEIVKELGYKCEYVVRERILKGRKRSQVARELGMSEYNLKLFEWKTLRRIKSIWEARHNVQPLEG